MLEQMGIERPTSRSSGIMDDEERLDKAKAWILSDMGGHLDEVWQDAVRALERVTVRGNYMHGDDTTLRDGLTLPLVCIGDAPRNCGLGGGGNLLRENCLATVGSRLLATAQGGVATVGHGTGNLALQDANELATLLEADDAFDETGAANLEPLRAAEAVMFERKSAFHEERTARMAATTHLVTNVGRGPYEWNDVRDGYSPFGKGFPAWVLSPRGYAADGSRRRRGCHVDIPWRRVAATPRPRRGYLVKTGARLRYRFRWSSSRSRASARCPRRGTRGTGSGAAAGPHQAVRLSTPT